MLTINFFVGTNIGMRIKLFDTSSIATKVAWVFLSLKVRLFRWLIIFDWKYVFFGLLGCTNVSAGINTWFEVNFKARERNGFSTGRTCPGFNSVHI
jgi:hypothetical protein